jgi:hypothetical protein
MEKICTSLCVGAPVSGPLHGESRAVSGPRVNADQSTRMTPCMVRPCVARDFVDLDSWSCINAAGDRPGGTAACLSISRSVVVLAYEQLLAEGCVNGKVGSGTYVVASELAELAGARIVKVRKRAAGTRAAGRGCPLTRCAGAQSHVCRRRPPAGTVARL